MSGPLGQCGWINWIEDGGDGSACPESATVQCRRYFDGSPMPVTASFCMEHFAAGTERLVP